MMKPDLPDTPRSRSWLFELGGDLVLVILAVAIFALGALLDSEPPGLLLRAADAASYERGRADAVAELAQTVAAAYAQGQRDQCGAAE